MGHITRDASIESVLERIHALGAEFRSKAAFALDLKRQKSYAAYITEAMEAVRVSFNIGLSKEMGLRLQWKHLTLAERNSMKQEVISHYREHLASYVQSRMDELSEMCMQEKEGWFQRALQKANLRIFLLRRLGADEPKKVLLDMLRKLQKEHERMLNEQNSETSLLTSADLEFLRDNLAQFSNFMSLLNAVILDNNEGVEEAGSELYIL